MSSASPTCRLAENADGSTARVSLGTVAAVDPDGTALSYSIEGGNASGLFEIAAASGELFYTGTGEDFEAGAGPFELTVRASDGNLSTDTSVSSASPTCRRFRRSASRATPSRWRRTATAARSGYRSARSRRRTRRALSYSLEGGNASGLFEIDAASGELFYVGAGEDFEAGTAPFDLTVRASDGNLFTDTSVTVGVTDVQDDPVDPPVQESVSEPSGQDFSANTSTDGRVVVGDSVTGNIGSARERDWFAVELEAGRTYGFDLMGSHTDDGELSDPPPDAKGCRVVVQFQSRRFEPPAQIVVCCDHDRKPPQTPTRPCRAWQIGR